MWTLPCSSNEKQAARMKASNSNGSKRISVDFQMLDFSAADRYSNLWSIFHTQRRKRDLYSPIKRKKEREEINRMHTMNTTNHWLLTHYYWPLSIHQNWFLFRSTKLIDICFRMYFVALLLLLLLLLLYFICASHLIAMPECGMELLRAHRHRRRFDLESTSECIYVFSGCSVRRLLFA